MFFGFGIVEIIRSHLDSFGEDGNPKKHKTHMLEQMCLHAPTLFAIWRQFRRAPHTQHRSDSAHATDKMCFTFMSTSFFLELCLLCFTLFCLFAAGLFNFHSRAFVWRNIFATSLLLNKAALDLKLLNVIFLRGEKKNPPSKKKTKKKQRMKLTNYLSRKLQKDCANVMWEKA